MTAFVPIRDPAQLPKPGAADAVEGHVLDFKSWHVGKSYSALEVAKDVAAFANASGGVLIYGADPDGLKLKQYRGPPQADAELWVKRVDEIVQQRCAPPPIIEPRAMSDPEGKSWVVVVNAHPSTGQAVGVRVLAKDDEWLDPETGKPARQVKGEDAFLFPMRAGEGTRWLNPEQIAMLMIPKLRRAIAQLREIGRKTAFVRFDEGTANHRYIPGGGQENHVEMDELRNYLKLTPITDHNHPWVGPIDAVHAVWAEPKPDGDVRWNILLSRTFGMGV